MDITHIFNNWADLVGIPHRVTHQQHTNTSNIQITDHNTTDHVDIYPPSQHNNVRYSKATDMSRELHKQIIYRGWGQIDVKETGIHYKYD